MSACDACGVNLSDHGYKKHTRGKILTSGEKQIVLNVFHKLMVDYPTVPVNDIVKLTAEYTGISESTIGNVRREFKITGTLKTPIKTRQRKAKTVLEKEECKIKLENEVLELEKTVTELEIKLKKELETSPTILGSPAPLAKTQAKQQQSTTAPLEKFTYKEPRKPLTDSGHPPVPFTEDSKKQAVKRKQTETHIAFFKPKVPSAHDKEVLSQLLEVPKTSERQLRNKFFKTKCNTNAVGKTPNVVDDFDYYKFD